MAQPPHFTIDGTVYFVTTRVRPEACLLSEAQLKIVTETILDTRDRGELILYAFAVMPDHLHLLIKPLGQTLSKTMQLIKGRSSRLLGVGGVWQKGFFDYGVLTENKFREKFNYIHDNAVRRGLAARAEEYDYSSAMHYWQEFGEAFYR